MNKSVTRLIFADSIEIGMILIAPIYSCDCGPIGHKHELNVLDIRKSDTHVSTIVITESGEQFAFGRNVIDTVLIKLS